MATDNQRSTAKLVIKRLVAIVFTSVACLCVGGIGAQAATPMSGSGTFQVTFVPVSVETADGNTFIRFNFVETTTGLLAGTRVGQGSLVIHPDGTLTARDSGIFTGTLGGSAPGTAIGNVEVSGTFSASMGQLEVSDGTGGLTDAQAKLVASGHAVGPTSLAGTYTGQAQLGTP